MNAIVQEKNYTVPQQRSPMFFDGNYGVYREEHFIEMLVFERKRSERSGKPFLLMLLTILGNNELQSGREVIRGAVEALSVFSRETDIKGWYRHASTLGVIFTETGDIDTDRLREKIYQRLHARFTEAQVDDIHISFHTYPDDGNHAIPGSPRAFTFYPDCPGKERSKNSSLVMKRIIDVIGGIAGILIFSPFFIMIPIIMKLTSPGPALFRQERVGQYGKNFTFLKFRSMYVNNNADVHKEFVRNLISNKASPHGGDGAGQEIYKITNDKRVTPLGRILRKTSLDELPQFFNVLKGDMSLAGPRPPIPYEIEMYDIWHRRRVMEVKPGITGLWQVEGRSCTTFDEMVRIDLKYARTWSLWLDIKILLKTPLAVVAGRGAY